METRLNRIDSFLAPDEHFHYARKSLPAGPPHHLHRHDFHELFMVETGTAEHWINGARQSLDRGSLVFVRPDDAHAFAAGETPTRIVNVLFRRETAAHLAARYADELSGRFFWAASPLPPVVHLSGPALDRALNLAHELNTAHRSLAHIEEFLLTVMLRIVPLPETAAGRVPDWLAAACARARDPEIFRHGAAGFVRAAGRGHEHVCRKTREHLGVTPSAFINRIRMEHAARLLAGESMSVGDVADDCGIENMSHFYRVFRAHYGVTPKAYRKQHQKSPF